MEKSIFNDTDSTTSTASEDYLKNYYPKKSDELKNSLIKPILPKPFNDPNTGLEIDDCYELSLLRFFHLIFGSDGIINFTNLTKYMDLNKKECQELQDFFLDYPGIFNDYQFYYSDAGIIIRKKWFELINLSISEFTIQNQIKLLENFFPKLIINSNNTNDILEEIYNQLNFNWDSFQVKCYESYEELNTSISKILNQKIFINDSLIFIWSITTIKDKINSNVVYFNSELIYS
jgi:hypothetical protein